MTSVAAADRAVDLRRSPLRICVLTSIAQGVGGMQRTTHDLVSGLVKRGHLVDVICPADPSLDPKAYGAVWHLLETEGLFADRDGQRLLRDTYFELDRERRFDVLHSESGAALPLRSRPAIRTPIVVRYHGTYTSLARAHLRRSLTRPRTAPGEIRALLRMTRSHYLSGVAWKLRDCISIAVSRDQVLPNSHSGLIPRSLIHTVPNGIDTELFGSRDREQLRREHELPGGRLLVVAGRIDREKGFDVAVRMLASIVDELPDVSLLVIGDGDREPALRRLAERLGVGGKVLFVGAQPPERVAELLAAADVFLFPTLRHEAGPIVLLEGMACGLPTIATRLGGITEVVQPPSGDAAGILVAPDDVAGLAAAVRTVLLDDVLAADLGVRARRRIVEEYTLDLMLDRILKVYEVAIARAAVTAAA